MKTDYRHVAHLLAAQHGVANRSQLLGLGLPISRLRSMLRLGLWVRGPTGVVRDAGAVRTWEQRLMEATLAGPGAAVISHRSAGALHLLDGCNPGHLEVTLPRGHEVRLPGFTLHTTSRWCDDDHTLVRNIPVTTAERTLADLGAVVSHLRVDQGVDSVLRHGGKLVDVSVTLERVSRPGPSGTGTLTRVLSSRSPDDPLVDTWFERLVVRALSRPDLPPLQTQIPVCVAGRDQPYRLDSGFPEWRVGIEAHSRRWHEGAAAERADRRRHQRLLEAGWLIAYVSFEQSRRPDDVRSVARELLHARGWLPLAA